MSLVLALLVPIKAFRHAKGRLAPVMVPAERAELARQLARGVIESAGDLKVSVVCDDHEVAAFAEALGASVLWTPGLGLSGAVGHGVASLGAAGVERVVVAHADLPHPDGFGRVAETSSPESVVLVPDRRRDGTNVIALPASIGFEFAYGPGSFERHLAEAARLGKSAVIIEDEWLSLDVDLPADLAYLSPLN